jgi:hypothetical protein
MRQITTESRYGELRTIEVLDEPAGIFCVYGKSKYTRHGEGMFDFEGGPFFLIGENFHGVGIITNISTTPFSGISRPDIKDDNAIVYITLEYTDIIRKRIKSGKSIFIPKKKTNRKDTVLEEVMLWIYAADYMKGEADAMNDKFRRGEL